MNNATVIGIDLAKNIFQLHGVDAKGQIVLRKKLGREQVVNFFANLPECLVGMESCASSAYWGRVIESCGHTVRRIHPKFIKAYRMANKNDANDAAAICEAVQRPHMRFVPNKSQEQLDIQAIHRVRERLVHSRTAMINQVRGLLAENGIVIKQGFCYARNQLPSIIADTENELSWIMRKLLTAQYEHINFLDGQVTELNEILKAIVKENENCQRLMQIPGIGILTATALLAVVGKVTDFKNGRAFSAYLGLVPKQYSTGGKQRLLGITKNGNSYVRTLLIHGARSVLRSIKMGHQPLGDKYCTVWITELIDRRGMNRASVALANKTARVIWSMLANSTEYATAA